MEGNRGALGVNALSIPAARLAIIAARDSGQPRATAAFRLTQSTRDEIGLVLYQALFDGKLPEPHDPATRAQHFRGVLFVTVRVDPMLSELSALSPKGLAWCVVEATGGAAATQLAGSLPCTGAAMAARAPRHLASRPLEFGGRSLELRVARQGDSAAIEQAGAWLFSLTGVAAAAMLGALLLVVTGQARRTELEVQAATTELRHEVAERRQAELALRQSESQLRSILDNLPLGVAFLDAHGSLLEGNPRLFEMLGSPPPALLGRRVAEVTHPDDQADMQRQHIDLLAGRIDVARGEARLLRGDGHELWVRLAASAQRDDEGRVQRMIAVVEDIGEHRRLEAAELAVHRAEAANRAKTEFVSRMSHELRTPLNAMIGFAQLLGLDAEPALPTHQRAWTQEIQRAGWHLLELINETLDLARIESGTIQVNLQPVPLAPLLANCRAMVAGAAATRRVVFDDRPAATDLVVLADPVRLRQVLTNLLSNAVKYNREGGQVTIRAAAAGGRITIDVEDSGIGMTPSQLQRLFVPYDRLGREGSGIEGTGIGLVISRRLTELMGGTLEAESRADTGTTFTVTLPAADTPIEAARADTAATRADAAHQHVLYIEDNPTNVEVMRGILGQRSQVQMDVAMLGLDGLVAARRQHPDLILLDMQLPDISGLELLRMLKNDDDLAGIPVIVVSADATPTRVRDALTLGAILYLTKPVDVRSLLQAVDDVLEGQPSRWNHSA
jgi:PAS domain S-box-containing protein